MTPAETFRARWRSRPRPLLVSVHRGLWGPEPENSLAAIAAAAPLGIVEVDLQLAADGVPVVHHDATLARMTGREAPVAALPSEDIAALPLRAGDGGSGAALTAHRVPTLAQLIEAAPPGAFFDFDAKHPEEVEALAARLAGHRAQALGSLKIDTASAADIARLRALERRHGLMVMAKVKLPTAGLEHIRDLARAGVAAAEVWFDDLGQLAEACAIAGEDMAVSTYTLDPVHCCGLADSRALQDPDKVWGTLARAGVSVVMTDRARDLVAWLDSAALSRGSR